MGMAAEPYPACPRSSVAVGDRRPFPPKWPFLFFQRLKKKVDLHLKTPPVWEWRLIQGKREGRAKVDGLELHISPAAASPSFELSCFVRACHKPRVEVSVQPKVLL